MVVDTFKSRVWSEHDQSVVYDVWKCHSETPYFVQLLYTNNKNSFSSTRKNSHGS
jgi:hypothetical protein